MFYTTSEAERYGRAVKSPVTKYEGSYLVGIGTGGPNTLTAIDNLGEFYTINTTTLEATDQGNSIIHGDGAGGTNSTLYVFDDNAGGLYSYNFNTGLDGG